MIKKINNILVFITLIGSILVLSKSKIDLLNILKILSIFLSINVINILKKMINISDKINFIYIVFIILAHFLGVSLKFYDLFIYYDKFIHFLFGVLASYITFKYFSKSSICIIINVLALASLWEMFEYICSIIFNTDPQNVLITGVNDTMLDIIVAFWGSIIFSIFKNNVNKKV